MNFIRMPAKKNERILLVAAVCALLVLVFWLLIYAPAAKKMKSLKREIAVIEDEISQIESRGGEKGRDIKKMVDSIHKDFAAASQRLPGQEEVVLEFISREANRYGLSISSMQPAPKKPMMDSNNALVFLEGEPCVEMSVDMQMKGEYKAIIGYIRELRENSPYLIGVEDVNIQRGGDVSSRLTAKVELTLCFSS